MKIIITEQQYSKAIDKFLTYQFEPHEEKRFENHPDAIYWLKNGEAVATIQNYGEFSVKREIWENISILFSFDDDEVEYHIKEWLEKHYKLGGLNPSIQFIPPKLLDN
jgi:hypothetical protein